MLTRVKLFRCTSLGEGVQVDSSKSCEDNSGESCEGASECADGQPGEDMLCTPKQRLEPKVVNKSWAGGTVCGPPNRGWVG